jgi:hypothetical protein
LIRMERVFATLGHGGCTIQLLVHANLSYNAALNVKVL